MAHIAFESVARLLVLLHAVAAIVLVGAATHHVVVAFGYVRGQARLRLGRIYAATSLVAYALTFVLGALAYPSFRYHVRGLYLDRHAAWASNLFEAKETFASMGLSLVIAAFVLSRVMDAKPDRSLSFGYFVFVAGTALIVWFNVLCGLLITLVKGV